MEDNYLRRGSSVDENHKKSFFDQIQSRSTIDNIHHWFLDHASPKEKTFTELQVIGFLRKLKDLRDWEIYDIFDIFGNVL